MKFGLLPVACMLAALHTPAIAISKCTGPDGKTVFQDAPCAGKGEKVVVKPASGEAPQQATAAGASSEGQRLQQQLNQMQSERRRRDLEIALPNAYAERASHSAACDQELSALRAKKAMANNNLAGATWQQSLSTEMAAVASRCETRNNNITTNIEALRKECQALGGCK